MLDLIIPNVLCCSDFFEGPRKSRRSFHWGGGGGEWSHAVLQASLLSKKIKLIGFDLYSNTRKINNLYKDTKNYDPSDKDAIDPRYWIHQIGKVFECFPKKKYTIYQKADWNIPKAWNFSNVSVDNIDNL